MKPHIAIVGAGAVGGYVGGRLTLAGERVTLIDPWPAHIAAMRASGLRLAGTQGTHVARMRALDICDVQQLVREPVDIAIISTKSYDTHWATALIAPYLAPQGYVVSLQNGMNEERIAAVVGTARTLGCIASGISVKVTAPGGITRTQEPGGETHAVFRVGELDGRASERAIELARLLSAVDGAEVTRDLNSERWTKLIANVMTHGLLGATGLDNRAVLVERGKPYRIGLRLAAEAVAVGRALGYDIGTVYGIVADDYVTAERGDAAARERVAAGLAAWMKRLTAPSYSSVGRDVISGRRTEIDFTNGLVADKGAQCGVPAPTHACVTELVRQIDRGVLKPHVDNLERVPVV